MVSLSQLLSPPNHHHCSAFQVNKNEYTFKACVGQKKRAYPRCLALCQVLCRPPQLTDSSQEPCRRCYWSLHFIMEESEAPGNEPALEVTVPPNCGCRSESPWAAKPCQWPEPTKETYGIRVPGVPSIGPSLQPPLRASALHSKSTHFIHMRPDLCSPPVPLCSRVSPVFPSLSAHGLFSVFCLQVFF